VLPRLWRLNSIRGRATSTSRFYKRLACGLNFIVTAVDLSDMQSEETYPLVTELAKQRMSLRMAVLVAV
jgi:hypothetical protein